MHVLYDSQIFTMQKFGGISRYFWRLVQDSNGLFGYTISGKYSENVYAPEISKMRPFPIKKYFKGKMRVINYINKASDSKSIKIGNFDVFHPTYYMPKTFPSDKPTIVSYYDMIHERYPKYFMTDKATVPGKLLCSQKSSRIIAISNQTKTDMLKFYPELNADKIDVVYLGIDWNPDETHSLSEDVKSKIEKKPYVLFTGQRAFYKNFNNFLKALAPLMIKYDLNFVCTGSGFKPEEKDLLDSLKIADRTYQFFASENDLHALYESALCFVFPSEYEGFGLPVLEGFASHCPTVLARASCFPEIAGEAAEYFDPLSIDDMLAVLDKVITSEELRKSMIAKGLERFTHFSDEECCRQTFEVYKKAVEEF
jgi:glycosyltransferase involved in cell wall biosynthesis